MLVNVRQKCKRDYNEMLTGQIIIYAINITFTIRLRSHKKAENQLRKKFKSKKSGHGRL